jgi:hypothetical protein
LSEDLSRGSELVLAQWKGSVIRRSGVTPSARGEAAPRRKNRGDDASWTDVNLTGQKMKKINMFDSAGTNER